MKRIDVFKQSNGFYSIMRKGFDQFCPDCYYAYLVNKVYGKCYCTKFRIIASRKRFPPSIMASQKPGYCDYFKQRNP